MVFDKAERSRKNIEKLERKLQERYSKTDKALVDVFIRRSDMLYLAFGAVQQDEG